MAIQEKVDIAGLKTLNPGTGVTTEHCIVDNYYAAATGLPGDGGGGIFTWDKDATGTGDQGNFIVPNGSPTTGRWRRVRQTVVSVRDFGCKADDSTDDTGDIHRARTAAGPGGIVRFPFGEYRANQLTVGSTLSNQHWIFDPGAVIRPVDGATGALLTVSATGFRLTGGNFDCDKANRPNVTHAVVVNAVSDVVIEDIVISNCKQNGIRATNAPNLLVDRVTISSTDQWCIQAEQTGSEDIKTLRVLHGKFTRTGLSTGTDNGAIMVKGGVNGKVYRFVTLLGNGIDLPLVTGATGNQAGIYLESVSHTNATANVLKGGTVSLRLLKTDFGAFNANVATSMLSRGVEGLGCTDCTFSGNSLDGTDANTAVSARGISILESGGVNPINIVVSSNTITGFRERGVQLQNCTRASVNANTISMGGTALSNSRHGVLLKSSTDCTVVGNTINGANGTVANGGVGVEAEDSWPVSIGANIFRNFSIAAVRFTSTSDTSVQNAAVVGNTCPNCGAAPDGFILRNGANLKWGANLRFIGNTGDVSGLVYGDAYGGRVNTGTTLIQVITGNSDPTTGGGVPTGRGSLYLRQNGSAGTTLYVKEADSATGWDGK